MLDPAKNVSAKILLIAACPQHLKGIGRSLVLDQNLPNDLEAVKALQKQDASSQLLLIVCSMPQKRDQSFDHLVLASEQTIICSPPMCRISAARCPEESERIRFLCAHGQAINSFQLHVGRTKLQHGAWKAGRSQHQGVGLRTGGLHMVCPGGDIWGGIEVLRFVVAEVVGRIHVPTVFCRFSRSASIRGATRARVAVQRAAALILTKTCLPAAPSTA